MKCNGCGAEIKWIKMKKSGKTMPVDAEPVSIMPIDGVHTFISEAGEEILVSTAHKAGAKTFIRKDGVPIIGIRIGKDFDYDAYPEGHVMKAYASHFATCPAAGKFRKGGGK